MSTTALKLGSLAIRTLAKPIASRIKEQARDHAKFRRVCVALAQGLHRIDMRLRLGILRDTKAIEKHEQQERQRRHAEALRRLKEVEAIYPGATATVSSKIPIPPTEEEHSAKAATDKTTAPSKPKIRPLSESKAIENGANFISEFFLFAVAGGLILLEQLRARRKEANRRDVVAERLTLLEDRNRQDEERLQMLEERDRKSQELIRELEEELWKVGGKKGPLPRRHPDLIEKITPTPLWEEPEGHGEGFWHSVWQRVSGNPKEAKEADLEKGLVTVKPEVKAEGRDLERDVISLKLEAKPAELPTASGSKV